MAVIKISPVLQEDLRSEAEQIMWIEGAISASESAPPIRDWPPSPQPEQVSEP